MTRRTIEVLVDLFVKATAGGFTLLKALLAVTRGGHSRDWSPRCAPLRSCAFVAVLLFWRCESAKEWRALRCARTNSTRVFFVRVVQGHSRESSKPGVGKRGTPLTIGWAFDGNPFGGGYGTGGTIVFTAELGRSRKRFCARHPVNEPDFCAF